MARRPRHLELKPEDFYIGDEAPIDPAVLKATKVEIGKLPRGAFFRVKTRASVQANDRAEAIAARADQATDAHEADVRRQERLARRRLAQGKLDDGVVAATDYATYVQRLMREMHDGADFEKRRHAARDFFSLWGMASLPDSLEECLSDAISSLKAPELLRLCRGYAIASAGDVLPAGSFVNRLYRQADPAVLLPLDTTMEVLSIMARDGQDYKNQMSFFSGLSGCAKHIAEHLAKYESATKKDAPDNWARPGDVLMFCRALAGDRYQSLRPTSRRERRSGVRRLTAADIPSFDRPDIAPLAKRVVEEVDHLVRCFPARRDRRRFRCIRRAAIVALKKAQIVNAEGVMPQPPIPRRVIRKRTALKQLAERRQP